MEEGWSGSGWGFGWLLSRPCWQRAELNDYARSPYKARTGSTLSEVELIWELVEGWFDLETHKKERER